MGAAAYGAGCAGGTEGPIGVEPSAPTNPSRGCNKHSRKLISIHNNNQVVFLDVVKDTGVTSWIRDQNG